MNSKLKEMLRDPECLFVHNHSGGKDSQASYLYVKRLFQRLNIPKHRLIVVHAELPEVEWPGTERFIKHTTSHQLIICRAIKTFFQMVAHRRKFPSPETRQCTSDLKRGPIEVVIRRHCKEHGFTKVVSIQGLRAQESAGRKKKSPFKLNSKNSNGKRTWYDWLPIHGWSTEHVFGYIAFHFQKPFWIYGHGMKRKSCCFCIMSCESDLRTAGKLMPQLARQYKKEERRLNFTLLMPGKAGPVFLDQII